MRCPRLILRGTICSTGLHDGGKLPAGATWPNPHGTEDRSMTVTDIATRTYKAQSARSCDFGQVEERTLNA